MNKRGGVVGGALLIAGTSIGAGMLALPVVSAVAGFVPALVAFFCCWLFMAATGLLYLEACLRIGKETNIITVAYTSLGNAGRIFAWIVYIFLFYLLTIAYIAGGGEIVSHLFIDRISHREASLLFLLVLAPFVLAGTRAVTRLNFLLMVGLGVSYVILFFIGSSHVESERLLVHHWPKTFFLLPVAFTAFGYQGVIPSLITYLDFDAKKLRLAILIGSFIPFVIYLFWEWLILGIVPVEGVGGLLEALQAGDSAIAPLRFFIKNRWVYPVARFFAFFAIVTSFLGVTLGLVDFMADGLKIKKKGRGKVLLALLVFVVPLFVVLVNPHLFLKALGYAGGIGGSLLLGLLPIMVVFSVRYLKKGKQTPRQLFGGKTMLGVLTLFVLVVIVTQLMNF
ncbi:tyrosine transporter [Simkania negevensis]|uniref:Tyrosine transporter n=1 Tax=Simkania negevensis TaxID=83561 RepID=A0ABS3AR75_9BACT|nr:tyrosine transporter [Simkania negevensis]